MVAMRSLGWHETNSKISVIKLNWEKIFFIAKANFLDEQMMSVKLKNALKVSGLRLYREYLSFKPKFRCKIQKLLPTLALFALI